MMTLSSAPTLMPSSVEMSGIAPALNSVPKFAGRQDVAVEEAAGEDQPKDADGYIEDAGKGFRHAEERRDGAASPGQASISSTTPDATTAPPWNPPPAERWPFMIT